MESGQLLLDSFYQRLLSPEIAHCSRRWDKEEAWFGHLHAGYDAFHSFHHRFEAAGFLSEVAACDHGSRA
jgi:hypothetical protein